MRLSYKLCRCGCEINDLEKEKTSHFVPFILLASLPPFSLLTPIRLSHSLGPFLPTPARLRSPPPRNCRLPRILLRLDLCFPEIAWDARSASKLCLESHRPILAPGLTERTYILRCRRNVSQCSVPTNIKSAHTLLFCG